MADLTPEQLEELNKKIEEANKKKEEELKLQREINKLVKEQTELEAIGSEERQQALKEKQQAVDLAEEELRLAILNKEATDDLVKNLREAREEYKKQTDYLNSIDADADNILTNFFGVTNKTKQFSNALKQSGGFTKLLKDRAVAAKNELGKVGGKALALNVALDAGKEIMKAIGGTAIELAKITAEPVKQAVNFENAIKKGRDEIDQFKLSARDLQLIDPGEIEKFRKSSMALSDTFRGTQEDVRNINVELFKASNAFRELKAANDPAADSLVKTSFLLQRRLNIPLSETAKLTEITSQAFGMSAKESEGFAASLSVLADEMGLDVRKVFSEFQSQANNLAKFGLPDIQNEFLELSKIQQQTGISIDSMMSSLEKFTTFEGALTAASQLNAVFGTTVDGLELMDTVMTEGPVEGFIKLRETLEATGIQIDQLNYAQMRQLTSTIGLSAEQMRKFGEVSTEELRSITAGSLSAEEAMGKLNAAQGEGETLAEQQKKVTDSLVKAIDGMVTATYALTEAMNKMAEQSPKTASAFEKFGKSALNIAAGVAGAIAGFFSPVPGGTAIFGQAAYTGMSAITSQFAPGDNYISKPTPARVGEAGSESIMRAQQIPQTVSSATGMTTVLNTGDRVVRNPTGGGPTNLTINLVGKDGKILETSTQTISEGQMDKAISHYLDTKVSLLNS
jgi:hypothetical protein